MKLVYFAPADIQIARVDRQCIVYACEGLQRAGVDVELVAMKVRLMRDELQAENPFDLYRLRTEPKLRNVRCLASQTSGPLWSALNRFLVHAYAALQHRREATTNHGVTFYTKNYSSAWLFIQARRMLMPSLRVVFEAHTLPHSPYQLRVLKNVDGIIANGIAVAKDLRPLVPVKPMLPIHQGVDLEHYDSLRVSKDEARRKLGVPVAGKNVIYTGKVYWGYKEVDLLIEASKHLPPDTELTIVGGRADHSKRYADHVRNQGLRNVRIVGFVPPREVQWYQLAADVLVSYYPTGLELNRYRSPGKLFEYMAAGRAIVTADYASLREVLDETSAVFVPPDNPRALAAALSSLLADESKLESLAASARRQVENYTWEVRARNIATFINSLNKKLPAPTSSLS